MTETQRLLTKSKTPDKGAYALYASSSNAADIIDISNGAHSDTPTMMRLIYLGIIVILPGVAPGMSFGFPAVALPQMPYLTIDQASWFASISAITMPIGCLLSGPIIDKYGRKSALMITNVPSLCGWLLMATKSDLINLYLSRLLSGLSVGLATTPAAVYAAECITIHNPNLRGSLSTWSTIALTSGILLSYLTGAFFRYTTVAYIGAAVSFLSLLLVAAIIPESPTWLHSQGRVDEAEASQRILKITQPVLQQEIMKKSMEERPTVTWDDIVSTLAELRQPEAYKPLCIMVCFLFFQQFAGLYVVITYMVDILENTGAYFVRPATGAIVNGVIILGAAISVSFILPKLGVRRLSLISCGGVSLSMLTVGVYMSIHDSMPAQNYYLFSFVPFLAILSSVLMAGLGFIPIPYSMLGEVFPTNVKGMAGGIASSLSSIFCFIAIKTYPYLFAMLGPGIFYMYAFVAFSCCLFVRRYLPETTGMTLSQIGDSFTDGYTPYTLID